MADKDENKGPLSKILDRILSDPEWLIVGYYAYNALRTGVVSEDAPEKAKMAAKGLGATVGGKGDPTDEAYFLYYSSGIAPGKTEKEAKELRFFLRSGLATVYRLNHESEEERERGLADFEEWRTILVRLGQIDPNFVIEYLTELAESFRSEFDDALEWVENTSKPIADDISEKRKKSIQQRRQVKAWERACDKVAEQMHSDSVKVPLYDLQPLGKKLWQKLKNLGPLASQAKNDTLETMKPYKRYARIMGKRRGKQAKRVAQKGWDTTKEKADSVDAELAQSAEELRTDRENSTGAYASGTVRFFDRINPTNLIFRR